MGTRIKICGITNSEDARAAIDYGADALGFIMVAESPRYVTMRQAYEIGLETPPFLTKVAVMRDYAEHRDVLPRGFTACQYYTNRLMSDPVDDRSHYRIRAYQVRDWDSLQEIAATYQEAAAIFLDTYHKDKLGGSGETFNWELAIEVKARFGLPIILAGGLTPDNVAEAVTTIRPYAVDVSSGVEAEPGRKDHAKLRAFIRAVRQADLG